MYVGLDGSQTMPMAHRLMAPGYMYARMGPEEDMNFVHLVINDSAPLGVEISRCKDEGIITVTRFPRGGQAYAVASASLLEPEVFEGAAVLGVNGVGRGSNSDGVDANNLLYKEMSCDSRPKSILFVLHPDRGGRPPDLSDAIGVHKRYGNFVELIFRKKTMGIKLDKTHDTLLKLAEFSEETEAIDICKECLLDPKCFEGASILRVNGKPLPDKDGIYEALKSSQRPKSVLFEIRQQQTPAVATGHSLTPNVKPTTPPPPPRNRMDRRASSQMRVRAVFATESVRSLNVGSSHNPPNDLTLICNVNESMRQLAIEEEGMDDNNNRRQGLGRLSGVSESMRQLQISITEMDELNATNDQKAFNRSSASMEDKEVFTIEEEGGDDNDNRRQGLGRHSDVSESMRQLQISIAEMEELNVTNDQEAFNRSSTSMEDKEALNRSNSSVDVEESPRTTRARKVLQSFRKRRFRRRTDSGRSIDIDEVGCFGTEEEKAQALEVLKREAYEACLDAITQHLEAFLSETPNVTYEEWIEELHPENASSRRNLVRGRSIDHRFYVEESDHRILWNKHLDEGRFFVPVREYIHDDGHQATPKAPKTFARNPPTG